MTAPLFIEKRLRPSIKVVNTTSGRYYYLRCPNTGTLIRLPANTRGDAERIALKYLLTDTPTVQPRSELTRPEASITRRAMAMRPALESILSAAFRRARKRGLPFAVDIGTLIAIGAAQDWRCAMSGISFEMSTPVGAAARREPYRPSIDRIDVRRGYTPDNIRLVCVAVNYALNAWGEDVLHRIVDGISSRRPKGEPPTVWLGKNSRGMANRPEMTK